MNIETKLLSFYGTIFVAAAHELRLRFFESGF